MREHANLETTRAARVVAFVYELLQPLAEGCLLDHTQMLTVLFLEQIYDFWTSDGEIKLFAGNVTPVEDVLVKNCDGFAAEKGQRPDEVVSVDRKLVDDVLFGKIHFEVFGGITVHAAESKKQPEHVC